MAPQKQSSLDLLAPVFKQRLEQWLTQARATFPQLSFGVSETRRTLARQQWLYGAGRPEVKPYGRRGVILTYTLDSYHRWGLAADLVIVRKTTPWRAEWDGRLWREVYAKVPPSQYMLRHLNFEFVHLECIDAAVLVARADELKLRQT